MTFFNFDLEKLRKPQPVLGSRSPARDGSNLASILHDRKKYDPELLNRVAESLRRILPSLKSLDIELYGGYFHFIFLQEIVGPEEVMRFYADSMSEGTVRALGILAVLASANLDFFHPLPLIGFEEPEKSLHPAALGVLLDELLAASRNTQLLVTTQSSDFLDHKDIPTESVLAVAAGGGVTSITAIDEAGRSAVRDRLFTVGELLRMNQLDPDPEQAESISEEPPKLFEQA